MQADGIRPQGSGERDKRPGGYRIGHGIGPGIDACLRNYEDTGDFRGAQRGGDGIVLRSGPERADRTSFEGLLKLPVSIFNN